MNHRLGAAEPGDSVKISTSHPLSMVYNLIGIRVLIHYFKKEMRQIMSLRFGNLTWQRLLVEVKDFRHPIVQNEI